MNCISLGVNLASVLSDEFYMFIPKICQIINCINNNNNYYYYYFIIIIIIIIIFILRPLAQLQLRLILLL